MTHPIHASAPPITDLTYQSLHTLVQQLSERTKRHRKSSSSTAAAAAKAMEPIIRDADHLLFSLKHHTMHSDSAASRVSEAQVWMYKAVMEKCAQNPEDEVMAYLTASSLWMSVEAERKALNIMTSSDALARAVLCCAMACNVLLTQKPNIATSPLPIKLTKMPNPYLSRCWSICMRLAHQLADYGAYEMSADYFELAAILVTCDVPPSPPAASGTTAGAANKANSVSNNNSFMSASFSPLTANALSATTPGKSSDADCRSNAAGSASGMASLRSPVVVGGGGRGSHLGAHMGSRNSNAGSPQQGGTATATGSPTHSVRSRATTTGYSLGAPFSAHRVFSGNVYGELSRAAASSPPQQQQHHQPPAQHQHQQQPHVSAPPPQTPPSLILNGFLLQYLVALSSCAMTSALIQDYARCLTVVDELLNRLSSIERSRRPELVPSWVVEAAQRRRTFGEDAHNSGMDDDDEGSQRHNDDDGERSNASDGEVVVQGDTSCVGEPLSVQPPILPIDIPFVEGCAAPAGALDGALSAEAIHSKSDDDAARPSTAAEVSEVVALAAAQPAALDMSDELVSATEHPLAFAPQLETRDAADALTQSNDETAGGGLETTQPPKPLPSASIPPLASSATHFHRDPLPPTALTSTIAATPPLRPMTSSNVVAPAAQPTLPRHESFSQRSGTDSATASSSHAGVAPRPTNSRSNTAVDSSSDGSPSGAGRSAAGRDANGGRTPVKAGTCPLAQPPGGSLHAHYVYTNAEHFSFLLETETVFLQMTVMKFLVVLIIRDPLVTPAAARAQIDNLLEVAYLYLHHDAYGASSGAASLSSRPSDNEATSSKQNGADGQRSCVAVTTTTTPSAQSRASEPGAGGANPTTVDPPLSSFPQRLLCLAEVLEIILDAYETFPADKRRMTSKEQELLLVDAMEEAVDLSRALGICSRNLLILFRRAETAVLRR